jgi:hypothetical protein
LYHTLNQGTAMLYALEKLFVSMLYIQVITNNNHNYVVPKPICGIQASLSTKEQLDCTFICLT